LVFLKANGTLVFARSDWPLIVLLVSTGVVTAVPLFWFGYAASHLRLVTLGFLQYLAPTISFFLGVFLYHEPFTRGHLIAFGLIWIALALFTFEALTRWRSARVRDAIESAVSETPA
jgi:chloramphenicol-sensitive protein RarD